VNASEVLNKAADLIEVYGWVQGHAGGLGTGFCAAGAIAWAAGAIAWTATAKTVEEHDSLILSAHVRLRQAIDGRDGIAWNDAPGRTKKEVIQKLREAANG